MDVFPTIETERIRLRKPEVRDIPQIVTYAGHPKIAEMTLNIPHPYQEKDAVKWLNMANEGFEDKSKYLFAICHLQEDEMIGAIGLKVNKRFNRAELGFWIGEPFWNNGYATEAVKEVIKFGFKEIDLNKIYAIHLVKNPASGKVMQNNGMIKEGELVEHIKKGAEYFSVIQYRLTRKEYFDIRN
ncbi:GNAT family N-acetyltransferase [Aliifodinibius sp. S!AR15-10]|uniref:GNAT family N-acetyltransferase n=1 Tax=Aliifodinibius sp. S!AR15-10 TaxID=2950437 RepID=UPI00286273C2|nr:GNAT family N-acetyltransferase [Aliifodinibius sp. S!AR15-10]MDR8392298.1 GNAT family N-acetyltransferase [Aliifodinibius sp. S!AR15-10]